MRIVKRHAGGPENQVINFFRPNCFIILFLKNKALIFIDIVVVRYIYRPSGYH